MSTGHYRSKQVIYFILPAMIFFVIFNTYPLIKAFQMSFYDWNIMNADESIFIGLSNYTRAFIDPIFWVSLRNTILYTLITVPAQMIIGLIIATLLNQEIRGITIFRTMFYLPVISSWVVVSLLFKYLFNGQAGLVNYILVDVLHILPDYVSWLQAAPTALATIMILGIWKGVGWSMIIFLAALQTLPAELRDASMIDGANPFQYFIKIVIPLLRPTMVFIAVMLVIGGFNVFISVFLMTGGGPLHGTEVLLTYMYHQGFTRMDFGYGAALSYILGAIIFVISAIQLKIFRKPVDM